MTVTGRTYNATRPRGLASWNPQRRTLALLKAVDQVLDDYGDHLPLTGRQVFYRLVATEALDKTENDYARLLEILNRARRSGRVAWSAIRDDGVTRRTPYVSREPERFWKDVRLDAASYRRSRLVGQRIGVEVWVEAAGMLPQVARVADFYGVPVQTSGGFDSVTAKHDAAQRFVNSDSTTVVLHVGDYDPSGCALIDSAADDIETFVADMGHPGTVMFDRLAVTPAQIADYGLPGKPQKATDRRGEQMAETVQAEALDPSTLAGIVETGIRKFLDMETFAENLEVEAVERDALIAEVDRVLAGGDAR